jgi:uncharacterized membrane protein
MIGFGIATYLALFQLGVVREVWEPFFGDGSRVILTSGVSQILPIPALGYLLDAIAGVIGGRARWRTMPWIVIAFGIAIGPLGAISIILVMIQPIVYGEWCTLCLASAVISVVMIGPAADEVLASLQHMRRARESGVSFWRALFGLSPERELVAPGPLAPHGGVA